MDKAVDNTVRLVLCTSPLEGTRKVYDTPADGRSVGQLLEEHKLRQTFVDNPEHAKVWLNDAPVAVKDFSTTVPTGGDIVSATLRPAGTAIVAALATTSAFAASTTGIIVAGVINAVLLSAVSLLASIVLAPKVDELDSSEAGSPSLLLSGGRNKVNQFGVVPKVYGRYRVSPPIGALSWTEFIGTTALLRQLFVWSVGGSYDISEVKIGQTPIESFNDFELETVKLSGEVVEAEIGISQPQNVSLSLNGSNQALESDPELTGLGNQFTVDMWVKPNDTADGTLLQLLPLDDNSKNENLPGSPFPVRDVLLQRVNGGKDFVVTIFDNIGLPVSLEDDPDPNHLIFDYVNVFPALNKWYYISVSFNGDDPENPVRVYVDDIYYEPTKTRDDRPVNRIDKEQFINVGWNRGASLPVEYFSGQIFSIGMWSKQLSREAVSTVFSNGAAGQFSLITPQGDYLEDDVDALQHWYRFCLDELTFGLDYSNAPLQLGLNDINLSASNCISEIPEQLPTLITDGSLADSLTLYSGSVFETQPNIQLRLQLGGSDPVTRATAANVTGFTVDLAFRGGLQRINEAGANRDGEADVLIWYRRLGAIDWIVLEDKNLIRQTRIPFNFRTSKFGLTPDTYEVKVQLLTRNTPPNALTTDRKGNGIDASANFGDMTFASLKSFSTGAPVLLPNVTVSALRIKASEQLPAGVVDTLSAIVESKLRTWDPVAGFSVPVVTRNPAWIVLDILTGEANSRAVPTSRIDLQRFFDWATYCDENDLTFDGVFDWKNNSQHKAAQLVCGAGRASLQVNGQIYSVIADSPSFRPAAVQMFTSRNSRGLSITKTFAENVHMVRAVFSNAEKDYATDTIEVFNDGFSADGKVQGTQPATVILAAKKMTGQTEAAKVWRAVRYDMLSQRLRPEVYSLTVGLDVLVARRGDKVKLSHWMLANKSRASARVADTADNGAEITRVILDEDMLFESGKSYAIELRRISDGTFVNVGVINQSSGTDVYNNDLELVNPIPLGSASQYDLVAWGEAGLVTVDCVITHVQNDSDLSATITMLDDAPLIEQTLATEEAPVFNPQTKNPAASGLIPPPIPTIESITRTVVGSDFTSNEPTVSVAVNVLPGLTAEAGFAQPTIAYRSQFRENPPSDSTVFLPQETSVEIDDIDGSKGFLRTTEFDNGMDDDWSASWWANKTGLPTNPADKWMLLDTGPGTGEASSIQIYFLNAQIVCEIWSAFGLQDRSRFGTFDSSGLVNNGLWNLNQWQNFVMTYNGAWRLYVDEVSIAAASTEQGLPTVRPQTSQLSFGMTRTQTQSPKARMMSLAIWNTDLTVAETAQIAQAGIDCTFNPALNGPRANNLMHFWKLTPAGPFDDVVQQPVLDWGKGETTANGTAVFLTPTNLALSNLKNDSVCEIEGSEFSVSNIGPEDEWTSLPEVSVTVNQIVLPPLRSSSNFDFRVWALGPGDVVSTSPALFEGVPVIGDSLVSAPTGFAQVVGAIVGPTATVPTLQFTWDGPDFAEAGNLVNYVIRWGKLGGKFESQTVFVIFGADFAFETVSPSPGTYIASISAVDILGQESEPSEIGFIWDPVVPILPVRVTGLEIARPIGAAPPVLSPSDKDFFIQWRKRSNPEFGECMGNIPLFASYLVQVWRVEPEANDGIDPTSSNAQDQRNLTFRGQFSTTDNQFSYPESLNLQQSGAAVADSRLAFVVRQADTNEAFGPPAVLYLDNGSA